jgi:YD repeat-containing protein
MKLGKPSTVRRAWKICWSRRESYDVFGSLLRGVDPNGVATGATFDELGRMRTSTVKGVSGCSTTADQLCNTDAVTTRTYGYAGPLTSETRPEGGYTAYTYEGRGRISVMMRGLAANDHAAGNTTYLRSAGTRPVGDPDAERERVPRVPGGQRGPRNPTEEEGGTFALIAAPRYCGNGACRRTAAGGCEGCIRW